MDRKIVKEKLIVSFKSDFYDLTGFILKHPGGITTLLNKNNKDIEKIFYETDHSEAAEHLLNEYKISHEKKDQGDENIENLVDWNLPMISQIPKLGDKYADWVNMPVDRPLKLFHSPLIESLTKTPWYLPLVWVFFIVYTVLDQYNKGINEENNRKIVVCVNLVCGVLIWTLLEYSLHRFLFHIDVKKYPHLSTFHFLIHGLHHKVPFDEYRLVFPPIPAAVLAFICYQPFLFLHYLGVIHYPRLLLAGALTGYLCYDMIHFYLHHGSPTNKYLYNLKRYHHNHHFVNHDKGFGISSTLWDIIFGTEIFLKKLKYSLQWKLST